MSVVPLQQYNVETAIVHLKPETQTHNTLRDCVREALETYLRDMDGHGSGDIYQLVLKEVEKPLFDTILRHTEGNQTKAAELLGINRGTLRKKLKEHGFI